MLTPSQIHRLVANYYVADYEAPIAPEILREVASKVVPGDKTDHLLLPPDDSEGGPYEVPLPRTIAGLETYIPVSFNISSACLTMLNSKSCASQSYSNLPTLRRLTQLCT